MLSSVSSVNFRGEAVNTQDLLGAPGKFSANQPKPVSKPDTFQAEEKEEKHSTAKTIGAIAAVALAAWAGLGIAVGRKGSSWKKIVPVEGEKLKFSEKVKNIFFDIGESANNAYKKLFKKEVKTADKNDTK